MAYNSADSSSGFPNETDSSKNLAVRNGSKFQVPPSLFADSNMDSLKRSLTLNVVNQEPLNSANALSTLQTPQLGIMAHSPNGTINSQLLRAHVLLPQLLESPDLKMLLGSPEFERMLTALSPMSSPFSAAARAPGAAEDAELRSALCDLYQRTRLNVPANDKSSSRSCSAAITPNTASAVTVGNVGADSRSRTDLDSPTVIRPIPLRATCGAHSSKVTTPTDPKDDPRSPCTLGSCSANSSSGSALDVTKRLPAALRHDASKMLPAVATGGNRTPNDDTVPFKTFTMLDTAQPSCTLAQSGIAPAVTQPSAMLLAGLPNNYSHIVGSNVHNCSMPNANTDVKVIASDDDSCNAVAQQQSAISSSSNAKMSRLLGRRAAHQQMTDSTSTTCVASTSGFGSYCSKANDGALFAKRRRAASVSDESITDRTVNDSEDDDDDDDDGEPPRRGHSTVRRSEEHLSLVERSKLTRKRERNRLAAQRCRERKVKRIDELQTVVTKLEDDKRELLERISQLTRDVDTLQRRIHAHEQTGCRVPLLISHTGASAGRGSAGGSCNAKALESK